MGAPNQDRDELTSALQRLWPHFTMAGLFSSAINLLYLASPLYLMQVYNRVLLSENVSTLLLLTLILAAALLTMAVLDTIRAQVLIRCGVRLDQIIAPRVFEALIVRSSRQGFSKSAHTLREFDEFRTFATGPGIYFAFDLPWIPLYLILLFFIHPVLGGVATFGAVLLLGLAFLNEVMTRRALRAAEEQGTKSFVFAENILRHSDVVLAMGMHGAVERHWRTNRAGMLAGQAYASDRNSVVSSAIRFARLLLQSLMLGAGAWLAIDHAIQPATIFAASIVMGRALVPVEQAVATWKQFTVAREAFRHVRQLLIEVPAKPEHTVLPEVRTALTADHLTYRVTERRDPIIKDVDFRIEEGQAVGIVGPSGSGKSTLARLMVGAIPPDEGHLKLGELEYSHWEPDAFGRRIGYLPQDVGLFAGTVKENIARFGEASIEEIVDASRIAGIHDMILALPRQYDTVLGPGGVGLSGGQRQRLGLARALLGKPSLLVLDEPNANLDVAGEIGLRDALKDMKARGTTIVVITHRTNLLEVVDMLMFVRAGKLEKFAPPQVVYEHIRQTANALAPVRAA
ncbi:peptidase [Azorhizobium oxalatiphilum]|uniref:Peptidase n=1 Tax=Azorhizobium oxalatiphilum TaxID=980631 RepID=A0A917FFN1_9HYPH|nr:type I secretion system permease/ATPase [Azorhizobium oxalatiphilum]GGF71221.1 peptidase [Azorhizobium oxalatiphilum]